jgi:hypothetical protein
MYTCFWLDPHRYHYLAYLQGSRTPRGWRGARLELGTLGGGRWLGDRTALYARARRCGVPLIESSHGFEDLRVMFLSLSASATTPGKHSSADYLCHSPVNGSRISMILGPAQRAALSRSGAPFWRRDKSSSSLRLASISAALSAAVSSPTGESTFRNLPRPSAAQCTLPSLWCSFLWFSALSQSLKAFVKGHNRPSSPLSGQAVEVLARRAVVASLYDNL